MMINNIKEFKNKLYSLITLKDKKDINKVLIIGFIVGLFELIGLALILIMIKVFTNPSTFESDNLFTYIYTYIVDENMSYFISLLATSVFCFYVLKLIFSIYNAKLMAKLTTNLYIDISKKLFENYLNYYYRDISKRNTADINQMLVVESDYLALMVSSIIYLLIHLVLIGLLYSYMIYTDWILTALVTALFIGIIFIYKKLMTARLILMGEERLDAINSYMRFIKSTFSNYKFIKGLDGHYIENNLSIKTINYKKSREDMLFWSETPRIMLEFIIVGMMIGILAFIKLKYVNTEELLIIVSAYALALIRMLPSLSRVLVAVNNINLYKKTLDMVHNEFKNEVENRNLGKKIINNKIFHNSINLKNISFQYPGAENKTLDDLTLSIKKGDKIAIVGESGSGKSTLLDILIGLHLPTGGELLIDTTKVNSKNIVEWRSSTSFVPQKIVLFESTVKENITFGKDYDEKLFIEVLEDVSMYSSVMIRGGIEAQIGDEISGFSGGQMQRLAFARALYQERDILFLDEATSSLNETIEIEIIDNILNKYKEKTIIAIVHKEDIISKFDTVIRIKDGRFV